ncbi:hypothetical protein SLE2022_223210 [Rubroshorea leprosula]
MARGLKKHLKRLNAPKHWMLDKLGGAFQCSFELFSLCSSLVLVIPLGLLDLDLYCSDQRHVLVDGKVRTDKTYPAGFMDVVSIPKTNENFRLLYDTKGRFHLHSIRDDEAKFKLCKVRSVQFGQKGIPYLNTYDGRTIRYPDPLIKANDTIKLDPESNKIVDFIKFDVGNVVMVTGGRNRGRIGVMKRTERSTRVALRQSTFKMPQVMSLHSARQRVHHCQRDKAVGATSKGQGYRAVHHRGSQEEACSCSPSCCLSLLIGYVFFQCLTYLMP